MGMKEGCKGTQPGGVRVHVGRGCDLNCGQGLKWGFSSEGRLALSQKWAGPQLPGGIGSAPAKTPGSPRVGSNRRGPYPPRQKGPDRRWGPLWGRARKLHATLSPKW